MEYELEKQRLPKMQEQNIALKQKVARYEKELEVVKWYIEVFEDGNDTREIVSQYYAQKKEHELLKEKTAKRIAKLTKQTKKLEKSNNEIL